MNPVRRAVAVVGHYDGVLLVALWTVWLVCSVTNALRPDTATLPALAAWFTATIVVIVCARRHRAATCRRCQRREFATSDALGIAMALRWRPLLNLYHRWFRLLFALAAGLVLGAGIGAVATSDPFADAVSVAAVVCLYMGYAVYSGLDALHGRLARWCVRCEVERITATTIEMPPHLAAELLGIAHRDGKPCPIEFGWVDEAGQRWYHPPGGPARPDDRDPFLREDARPCLPPRRRRRRR